jgi:hypothetical protein
VASAATKVFTSQRCGTVMPVVPCWRAAAGPTASMTASCHISSVATSPESALNAALFRSHVDPAAAILALSASCPTFLPSSLGAPASPAAAGPAPAVAAPATSPPSTARTFADAHISSVDQNRIVVSLEHVTAT